MAGLRPTGIHHVHQAGSPIVAIPANPLIAGSEIEDGIGETEEANQLPVAAIPNKETHPSTIAPGHWHRPQQACESKELAALLF
jgi:hypothetical protein